MKTIIINIAEIIQIEDTPKELVRGTDMRKINTLKDAYLEIENDLIKSYGRWLILTLQIKCMKIL